MKLNNDDKRLRTRVRNAGVRRVWDVYRAGSYTNLSNKINGYTPWQTGERERIERIVDKLEADK